MHRYWFRPKKYGYGATPVTWEGWAITLGTVLAMLVVSHYLRLASPSPWALAATIAFDAAALAALVVVSRRKTAGEWRWRWGDGHGPAGR